MFRNMVKYVKSGGRSLGTSKFPAIDQGSRAPKGEFFQTIGM